MTTLPSPGLPRTPHPAVQALCDSLERNEGDSLERNGDRGENGESDTLLDRMRLSAAWRNRHSQAELYPVSLPLPFIDGASVAASTSTSASKTNPPRPHTATAVTFHVRQVQRGECDDTYGTGATVWPASMVLLRYLARLAASTGGSSLRGKTVVDLGSGTAVTSIGAALLGSRLVVCTDGDERVVRLARDNVRQARRELNSNNSLCRVLGRNGSVVDEGEGRNDAGCRYGEGSAVTGGEEHDNDDNGGGSLHLGRCEVRVRKYMWGDGSLASELKKRNSGGEEECPSLNDATAAADAALHENDPPRCHQSHPQCFDVVLASDCVLPKLFPLPPLVSALDELMGVSHSIAYLSYEYRYYAAYDPKDEFIRLANERGLNVRVVPANELDSVYKLDDVEVWEIRRRPDCIDNGIM